MIRPRRLVATLILGTLASVQASAQCDGIDLSGPWDIGLSTACGTDFEGTTTITQTGCSLTFSFQGIGDVEGELDPVSEEAELDITLPASCGGQTVGRLEIAGEELDLFWGDGADCCGHGGGTMSRSQGGQTEPGAFRFTESTYRALEGDLQAEVEVERFNGTDGDVTVEVVTEAGEAAAGEDFVSSPVVVSWKGGEGGTKTASLPLLDDDLLEGSERFQARLQAPTGGAGLGPLRQATVRILDDDGETTPCAEDEETLCLNVADRFRVRMTWTDFEGTVGTAKALPFQRDSGIFYFFEETNAEVLVKVLDACALPGVDSFWVFFAATTNVGFEMVVTDTMTGVVERYTNEVGNPAPPVLDTAALPVCDL